jgi:predicted transcriptional regulator of viral defense system
MKKTKELAGLSPNQERIMSILEYKKIDLITRKELIALIKDHIKAKDILNLIEKLQEKKKLVSIKRGVYMVVPFASIDKIWALDEYRIIDYLLKEDYYIGLYNSFNLHGFTEQIPNKMFVFNTKYSGEKKILHHSFKFFKIKKARLFGIFRNKYPYSNKERTIIDVLDYPGYLGGLSEVLDRIRESEYNEATLIDYAIKYNSIKILKLVGLLTGSKKLFDLLNKKKAFSYYTTIKKTGVKLLDKEWKIRLI